MDNQGQKKQNNISNTFYAVIGIATLMIAIMGATFAYFTATAGDNNTITGNAATISFDLSVTKVVSADDSNGGLIPMSNSMVETAVSNSNSNGGSCIDDNGNAVCQVYQIVVTNTSTASMLLDGYVSLTGGSGTATDITAAGITASNNQTTMRWAQAFASGSYYTTAGSTLTTASGVSSWTALAAASGDSTGHSIANLVGEGTSAFSGVTSTGTIQGNTYDIISKNYIRISDHKTTTGTTSGYTRSSDVTSALVYNQYLAASGASGASVTYYIVVWLSETGTDQTLDETSNFFSGNVTFISAQGYEVTATFAGQTKVESNQAE